MLFLYNKTAEVGITCSFYAIKQQNWALLAFFIHKTAELGITLLFLYNATAELATTVATNI